MVSVAAFSRRVHSCVDTGYRYLAPSNNRKQVSQFIVEHFPNFNSHAVQFISTFAKVTFASEVSKRQVIGHQIVNINGVQSAVQGGGPRAECFSV